jgi:transcriptional regulator with XRE-family HTH domain
MFYMRNIIGNRVKQARLAHKPKLTQQALAARLQTLGININRSGVAKIEMGIRQVTDIEVMLLAQTLEVSVAWLFQTDHDS